MSAFSHFHPQPIPDDQFERLLDLLFGSEPTEAVAA